MAGPNLLSKIDPSDHDQAFGTYCMSGPKLENGTHLLDVWKKTEGHNREALLSSCAALLFRDSDGKLFVLSAPRLCMGKNKNGIEARCIAGHAGNALAPSDNKILWIPAQSLCQEFEDTLAVLPLEFGHGVDMDLKEFTVQFKLTLQHKGYHHWLNKKAKLEAPVASLPSDSQAFKVLEAELERIRFQNLEKWLEKQQNGSSVEIPNAPGHEENSTRDRPVEVSDDDDQENTREATSTERNTDVQPEATTANTNITNTVDSPTLSSSPVDHRSVSNPTDTSTAAPSLLDQTAPDKSRNATREESSGVSCATKSESNTFRSSGTSPKKGMKQSFAPVFSAVQVSDHAQHPSPAAAHGATEKNAGEALSKLLNDDTFAAELSAVVESPKKRERSDLPQAGAKKQKTSLGEIEDKIVKAFAEYNAMHKEEVSKLLVALLAGHVNPESQGYKAAWKELLDADLVKSVGGGLYSLTNEGKGYIPAHVNAPKSNSEFHDRLLPSVLKKKGATDKIRKIWKKLSDGKKHDTSTVSKAAGHSNSQSHGFKSQIDVLLGLDFVEKQGSYTKGTLALSKDLFPFKEEEPLDFRRIITSI